MTTEAGAQVRMRGLHADHSVLLRRYLLRFTYGDKEAADDLLQETMIRAWRHLPSVPDETNRARRWLFTVARNAAIDSLRAKSSRPHEVDLLELTTAPPAEDTVETLVALESIRDAMDSLSEDHRAVLEEMYVRGRSAGETADLLGVPVGTVKSRAHYALRSLRYQVGPSHTNELCALRPVYPDVSRGLCRWRGSAWKLGWSAAAARDVDTGRDARDADDAADLDVRRPRPRADTSAATYPEERGGDDGGQQN